MMWLQHILGLDSANGNWYLFWSGFASDLSEFAILGLVWRRLNCHTKGCWRLGLHHEGNLSVCTKHRSF